MYTEKHLISFAEDVLKRAEENKNGISDGVLQDWKEKQIKKKKLQNPLDSNPHLQHDLEDISEDLLNILKNHFVDCDVKVKATKDKFSLESSNGVKFKMNITS